MGEEYNGETINLEHFEQYLQQQKTRREVLAGMGALGAAIGLGGIAWLVARHGGEILNNDVIKHNHLPDDETINRHINKMKITPRKHFWISRDQQNPVSANELHHLVENNGSPLQKYLHEISNSRHRMLGIQGDIHSGQGESEEITMEIMDNFFQNVDPGNRKIILRLPTDIQHEVNLYTEGFAPLTTIKDPSAKYHLKFILEYAHAHKIPIVCAGQDDADMMARRIAYVSSTNPADKIVFWDPAYASSQNTTFIEDWFGPEWYQTVTLVHSFDGWNTRSPIVIKSDTLTNIDKTISTKELDYRTNQGGEGDVLGNSDITIFMKANNPND